jgi:tetratricopeptide (TPR) repeat protein
MLLIGPDPASGLSHLQRTRSDPALNAILSPVFDAERLSVATDDPAYRLALLGVAFLDLDVSALHSYSVPDGHDVPDRHPTSDSAVLDDATHHWTVDALKEPLAALALRSLLSAIQHNPNYADAYAYLGQAADELGWSDWALAAVEYALQLAPESPVVQTLTGLYWDRRGQSALARTYFEAAYQHDKTNPSLCLEIATTYASEGQYTAAEVWLLFAVEVAPDDPQVWETLTRFYLETGNAEKESGLLAATRLLELAPEDANAHDLMGWAFFLTAADAQAQASLTQALTLDPTLASAHYHLGRLHARQDRYAEALRDYLRAANFDKNGQLTAQLDRSIAELPAILTNEP